LAVLIEERAFLDLTDFVEWPCPSTSTPVSNVGTSSRSGRRSVIRRWRSAPSATPRRWSAWSAALPFNW